MLGYWFSHQLLLNCFCDSLIDLIFDIPLSPVHGSRHTSTVNWFDFELCLADFGNLLVYWIDWIDANENFCNVWVVIYRYHWFYHFEIWMIFQIHLSKIIIFLEELISVKLSIASYFNFELRFHCNYFCKFFLFLIISLCNWQRFEHFNYLWFHYSSYHFWNWEINYWLPKWFLPGNL